MLTRYRKIKGYGLLRSQDTPHNDALYQSSLRGEVSAANPTKQSIHRRNHYRSRQRIYCFVACGSSQ
jgi:hypothetical protein